MVRKRRNDINNLNKGRWVKVAKKEEKEIGDVGG